MYGIRKEVDTFVDCLLIADGLRSVQIVLRNWEDDIELVRTVLEPLQKLMNVRDQIEVLGLPPAEASQKSYQFSGYDEGWRERKCLIKPGDPSFEIDYADATVEEIEAKAHERLSSGE